MSAASLRMQLIWLRFSCTTLRSDPPVDRIFPPTLGKRQKLSRLSSISPLTATGWLLGVLCEALPQLRTNRNSTSARVCLWYYHILLDPPKTLHSLIESTRSVSVTPQLLWWTSKCSSRIF